MQSSFRKNAGLGMKQEQKSERVSEKLWNLSQSSGTTGEHFRNDRDVVLGLAVENSWTEKPNDRFQELRIPKKCSVHVQWWEGVVWNGRRDRKGQVRTRLQWMFCVSCQILLVRVLRGAIDLCDFLDSAGGYFPSVLSQLLL